MDELLREMRQDAINEEYAINVARGHVDDVSIENVDKVSPKKEVKKATSNQTL